jgi:predicted 2-oxoglutarate/Fe(II)-dependent dioxygenase YbiX
MAVADRDVPLLIRPRFLSLNDCERIRDAINRGAEDPAQIVGDEITTHDTIRRTFSIEIEATVRAWLEHRLDQTRAAIEQALHRRLGAREGVGLLRYPPGGFYLTHRDRGQVAGWPAAARRAASVVVFLNGSMTGRQEHAEFEGGELCLYPDVTGRPVSISPEVGTLVAFPAEVLHEVQTVRHGTRDTAVDWFYDA